MGTFQKQHENKDFCVFKTWPKIFIYPEVEILTSNGWNSEERRAAAALDITLNLSAQVV